MVEPSMVRVLGRSAFHDTALTSSGDLCYLGGEVGWFVCLFVCFVCVEFVLISCELCICITCGDVCHVNSTFSLSVVELGKVYSIPPSPFLQPHLQPICHISIYAPSFR